MGNNTNKVRMEYKYVLLILKGATLFGGGGGGPYDEGVKLLEPYKREIFEVSNHTAMIDNEYATVVAMIGNPSDAGAVDSGGLLYDTFEYMRRKWSELGNAEISSCYAGELGGFNTAVPFYLQMRAKKEGKEVKIIDCDGSGRAVPGIDTSLVSIITGSATPFALVGSKNPKGRRNKVLIEDAGDSSTLETIARNVVESEVAGKLAGFSCWVVKAENMPLCTNLDSLSKMLTLGALIEGYGEEQGFEGSLYDFIHMRRPNLFSLHRTLGSTKYGDRFCRISGIRGPNETDFDAGVIEVSNYNASGQVVEVFELHFLNENLVLYKKGGGKLVPLYTVPEIITLCWNNRGKFMPLSNDYLVANKEKMIGEPVELGVLRADRWWDMKLSLDGMTKIWRRYFDHVKYMGKCLPLSQ